MRTLFVSLYPDTPHFETELELMSDLLEQEDEIIVLRCLGALVACHSNPTHSEAQCVSCVSKIDNGLGSLAAPDLRVETLAAASPDPRLPREFDTAEDLKAFVFDGVNLGRGVYSTICSRINKDTRPDTHKHATAIRTELAAAHSVYVGVRDALRRLTPDRVYIFNGRFAICYAVILACEQAGVDYYTHERGGTPDRYLVRRNSLPHDLAVNHAEILATWDESGDANVARRWYQDRRDGVENSWASFTKEQAVGRLPEGFDHEKRNIAIFNSTMEEYAAIKGWESPIYFDEVVGVRTVIEALRSDENVHFYLRIHPHLKNIPRADNYQLREYLELERACNNVTVIWPESIVHTYALLDHCDVTLTFGSTIGAEACFWKRPSVLAGRSLYEELDCAYVPKDHDELVALLRSELTCKPELGALKYAYWETVRGQRFRRFEATGLYSGNWLGRPCRPTFGARLQSVVLTALKR